MALRNVPFWLVEALKGLKPSELKELAEKAKPDKTETKNFKRTLERIRKHDTQMIRSSTLERLQAYLKPLPLTQERIKEIAQQIIQKNNIFWLYIHLLDRLRTGLRIHELLVERGWVPMDLAQEIHRVAYEQAGLKHKAVIPPKEAFPSEEQRRKVLKRIRKEYEKDARIAREMGLSEQEIDTPRLEAIILGEEVALPHELALIARALDVPLEEIFCAQPSGIEIFREVLAASSRESKYRELNQFLDELRLRLGLRLN